MKRLKLFVPIFIFFVLALLLYSGLGKNPQELPSVLLGKPLPDFELPLLGTDDSVTDDSLIGEPFLMNIWATWCATCLVEHPYLHKLSEEGVKIVGVNYKDDEAAAIKWLDKYKNPYAVVVVDAKGRLGFDLGITGAPETFLVNASGDIVYRHVGEVDEAVWTEHFEETFKGFAELPVGVESKDVEQIGAEI